MRRIGYVAIGLIIGLVSVPTAVGAAVGTTAILNFTGIEGANGNKANVTTGGQLETAPADPANFFQGSAVAVTSAGINYVVATPPTANPLVVTSLVATGSGFGGDVEIMTGTTCTGAQVGTWKIRMAAPIYGGFQDDLSPGLVVPVGDSLCGTPVAGQQGLMSASGYTLVPR